MLLPEVRSELKTPRRYKTRKKIQSDLLSSTQRIPLFVSCLQTQTLYLGNDRPLQIMFPVLKLFCPKANYINRLPWV